MPTKARLTDGEFHASREYLELTAQQRVWVDAFLNTPDALQATKTAYKSADETARTFTYRLRANPRVRAAVNLALGRSEQEAFLDEVKRDIDRAPVGSDRRVRAEAMYARMKWGDSEPANKPENQNPRPVGTTAGRVPPGCRAVTHKETGVLLGYITPEGERVSLAAVEVTR